MTMKMGITREWRVPWELAEIMAEVKELVEKLQITIKHVFREGNLLADYLAANAFIEGNRSSYSHYN